MLTIDPRPASAIAEPKTCVTTNTPRVLTSRTRRNSSASTPSIPPPCSGSGGWSMPALLTSTSGAPMRSRSSRSASPSVTLATSTPSPGCRSMRTTRIPAPSSAAHHTGPRFPDAPVTTASLPRSSVLIRGRQRAFELLLLEQLEGEGHLLDERMPQLPTDDAVELVRRQPVARRLEREILALQHVTRRELPCRDDLLPHL